MRKLLLAVAAVAVAAVSLVLPFAAFAAVISPADISTDLCCTSVAALAAPTAVALPWGDWIALAGRELLPAVSTVLVAVVTWAVHRYVPLLGAFVSQALVERLVGNALAYALNDLEGAAKGKVLSVPLGSAVVASAAQRAVDAGLPWLVKQAGGPAGIAEKAFRSLHLEENATAAAVLGPALAQLKAGANA
ncbi:hypothetical protein OPKNFCMD_3816 [Methylobacterium crusticola]|uniref:DUF697 domain-containing protein n=1 Tax=Methylobacterium crusticola TaxID=1697972 RepID=A0ABQ4R1Q4_9HYPH|nr:hypothetical protein [Methylobacterium crusticola]GJD51065.1 hypothetical protein OPKNFCMD_3816 [Methylobacterium crusticola]